MSTELDLSEFLKAGAVSNLDWLEVNEEDYRRLDRLPKQNLDFAPDLEAMWAHEGKSASAHLVPNSGAPRPADLSEVGVSKESSEQVLRVARLALMQSRDLQKFKHALVSRFDKTVLRASRGALASLLQERGLLGSYYLDAADFPGCHQAPKKVLAFVRKYASSSLFVVSKSQCQGCVHAGDTCGVFQKKLVLEVPYSESLAKAVERSQSSKGKQVQANTTADPKDRIRLAFLADDVSVVGSAETPKPILNPSQQLREVKAPGRVHLPVLSSEQQRLIEAEQAWEPEIAAGKTASSKVKESRTAFEIVNLLRREMLRGRGESELLQSLKLSFSLADLKATRASWEPLFKQAGFYGTIYATQTSFDDCPTGADFLAKFNPSLKVIVAGGKCQGCFYNKMARCMMYGRPLVARAEDAFTPEVVQSVIWEHRLAGRLSTGADKVVWGSTPQEALKAIYRVASEANQPKKSSSVRSYVEQAFRGKDHRHVTAGLTKREILRATTRYLNEGLYGAQLEEALRRRFDPRDLVASREDLKSVMAEQGLQGIYFVDPTIYEDYAKGCEEGARLHRARLVPYVKLGSKCSTCISQSNPGTCSKYNKPLVVDPPYADKQAQQREILDSGNSTEVSLASLMNGSKSIVAEFGMQSMTIDLDPEPVKGPQVQVELGGTKFDL